jgi:hypothetical protein
LIVSEYDYPRIGRYTGNDPQLLADLATWQRTGKRPPSIDAHLQRIYGAEYTRGMGILPNGELYRAPNHAEFSWGNFGKNAATAAAIGVPMFGAFSRLSGSSPSGVSATEGSEFANPGEPGIGGAPNTGPGVDPYVPGGTNTGGGNSGTGGLSGLGGSGGITKAIAALGAALLGKTLSGNAAENNVPPELKQMLQMSMDRSQYQNPLFQAATQGTYRMLPNFAREGTTLSTNALPNRQVT